MEIEVNKKEVDLRYVFGILIFWIGAGLVVLIFIDFLIHNVQINPIAPLIPSVLIPLGIYMMKTSRYATSVGNRGWAGVTSHLRGGIR